MAPLPEAHVKVTVDAGIWQQIEKVRNVYSSLRLGCFFLPLLRRRGDRDAVRSATNIAGYGMPVMLFLARLRSVRLF